VASVNAVFGSIIWFKSKSLTPVEALLRSEGPFVVLNAIPVVNIIPSSKGNVLPGSLLKYP